MKIKTIAALLKKHKHMNIYTAENGEQWISDGCALYSMRGIAKMSAEGFLKIFDVPGKKTGEWHCNEFDALPAGIDFSDYVQYGRETDNEPEAVNVEFMGRKMWLFTDGQKIHAIDEDYLKPLFDEMEYLTFHKRQTDQGQYILACKIALELKALILPVRIHTNEKFVESIARIGGAFRSMAAHATDTGADTFEAYHAGEFSAAERDEEPEPGQENMFANVDPATGEIIESEE